MKKFNNIFLKYLMLLTLNVFLISCGSGSGSSLSSNPDAPEITITGSNPLNIYQGSEYSDQGATAVDKLGDPVAVSSQGSIDTSTIGIYTITYKSIDAEGNVATVTRTVNVVVAGSDITPPVIVITGSNPLSISLNSSYSDAGATATDDFDGSVGVDTDNPVDTETAGTYTVTYTATDAAGNTATATRTVIVGGSGGGGTDTIPPVITIIGANPVTIAVNSDYTDAGATAMDNVDGSVTVDVDAENVDTEEAGTYTVTYTATDVAGNTATATRTVIVAGGGGDD